MPEATRLAFNLVRAQRDRTRRTGAKGRQMNMRFDEGLPAATVLVGRTGGLRPLDPRTDLAPLFELSHGEDVDANWAEMKVGPFADETGFASYMTELLRDPKRAMFAVVDANDTALGWLCLMEARPMHKVIELGFVLFTAGLRRTTLGTEALYLIMHHVFDDLGFRRLEWTCTAENTRSRSTADRLGFSYEGILRQGLQLKGRPRDICMYSMLSSEWATNRDVLRAWMNPANFDAGQRICSVAELRR